MIFKIIYRKYFHRIPDFHGEVNPSQAKYDDRAHFVRVDATYELKTHPYNEYDLWNRLFPN